MSAEALFEETPKVEKFTERKMLDFLHDRYGQVNPGNGPRYVCAEHVKNQAGFDARRCADFISIDCWPTKGLELHGHEVKVSRSDWLHELKQPEKAEAFKRYMDRWWLVVPDVAIVKDGELPEGWGLMALSSRGALRVKVQAPQLNPEPLPRDLLATLMRSTAKTSKRRSHGVFCTAPCRHPSWMFA
jgi:hypothetical protein